MADAATLVQRARRELDLMRSFVRRTGLTGWVKDRRAGGYYREAFAALAAVEDALGTDAPVVAQLGDRLRGLYDEARAAGLLSDQAIIAAERAALGLPTPAREA